MIVMMIVMSVMVVADAQPAATTQPPATYTHDGKVYTYDAGKELYVNQHWSGILNGLYRETGGQTVVRAVSTFWDYGPGFSSDLPHFTPTLQELETVARTARTAATDALTEANEAEELANDARATLAQRIRDRAIIPREQTKNIEDLNRRANELRTRAAELIATAQTAEQIAKATQATAPTPATTPPSQPEIAAPGAATTSPTPLTPAQIALSREQQLFANALSALEQTTITKQNLQSRLDSEPLTQTERNILNAQLSQATERIKEAQTAVNAARNRLQIARQATQTAAVPGAPPEAAPAAPGGATPAGAAPSALEQAERAAIEAQKAAAIARSAADIAQTSGAQNIADLESAAKVAETRARWALAVEARARATQAKAAADAASEQDKERLNKEAEQLNNLAQTAEERAAAGAPATPAPAVAEPPSAQIPFIRIDQAQLLSDAVTDAERRVDEGNELLIQLRTEAESAWEAANQEPTNPSLQRAAAQAGRDLLSAEATAAQANADLTQALSLQARDEAEAARQRAEAQPTAALEQEAARAAAEAAEAANIARNAAQRSASTALDEVRALRAAADAAPAGTAEEVAKKRELESAAYRAELNAEEREKEAENRAREANKAEQEARDAKYTADAWYQNLATIAQSLLKSYDMFPGIAKFGTLFLKDDSWMEWRNEVSQALCDTIILGGKQCWTSKICDQYIETKPEGNSLIARTPDGQPTSAIHLEASKSLPMQTETQTEYIYRIEYSLTNPTNKQMAYNLQFTTNKGTTIKLYNKDKQLQESATNTKTGSTAIYKQSDKNYTAICLTFTPAITTFAGKTARQFCNSIQQYEGQATMPYSNTTTETEEQTGTQTTPTAGQYNRDF